MKTMAITLALCAGHVSGVLGHDVSLAASACHVFDAAQKRYSSVELAVTGDWQYRNVAPEAQKLAAWLAPLARPPQR
jgi:hypothetical protein